MKFVFAVAAMLFASTSFAQSEQPQQPATGPKAVFSCIVASEGAEAQVAANITLVEDQSADFVVIQVSDKGTNFQMFAQLGKGELAAAIAAGGITNLMADENVGVDGGVIRNAGVLALGNNGTGWSGFLAGHGNVYPLTCKAN